MLFPILLVLGSALAGGECGGITLSQYVCDPGDEVEATVCFDAIEATTYDWQLEAIELDEVDGATARFTCPNVACPSESYAIRAIGLDAEGNQMWAFEVIEVQCVVPEEMNTSGFGGCGGAGTAALLPAALLLGRLGRRGNRRQVS